MDRPNYIEMKTKDIKVLKEKIWTENDFKCPVLNKEIPLDKMVLDHAHKRKDESYAKDKGTIRTALDFRVNAVLGKLENSLKRTGLNKEPDFNIGEFLRNAALYFEAGAYKELDNYFIHPNEVPKRKKVMKSEYNRVKKYYFKLYPRRKKLIKKPTYVSESWIELVQKTEDYIRSMKK